MDQFSLSLILISLSFTIIKNYNVLLDHPKWSVRDRVIPFVSQKTKRAKLTSQPASRLGRCAGGWSGTEPYTGCAEWRRRNGAPRRHVANPPTRRYLATYPPSNGAPTRIFRSLAPSSPPFPLCTTRQANSPRSFPSFHTLFLSAISSPYPLSSVTNHLSIRIRIVAYF